MELSYCLTNYFRTSLIATEDCVPNKDLNLALVLSIYSTSIQERIKTHEIDQVICSTFITFTPI